jgi:predicted enzyme related to lactoylglutathione lyase
MSVVINTQNHDTLVEFWKSLLGVEVAQSFAPYFTWLKPQHDGGVMVAIQAVPDPTPGRRRLHLDTVVEDLDAAIERITELGGSFVEDHDMQGFVWKVMADPDGNEFCIAPRE